MSDSCSDWDAVRLPGIRSPDLLLSFLKLFAFIFTCGFFKFQNAQSTKFQIHFNILLISKKVSGTLKLIWKKVNKT